MEFTEEHWQEVRGRAAIAFIQVILPNAIKTGCSKEYIKMAVGYADELIKELKKK